MQVVKEELKYQQIVLKHLGFYKGPIDGIWSTGTINAKKQFEFKREFSPAIPSNGLPFGLQDRLPKGLHFKRVGNLMFLHANGLEQSVIDSMLGKTESTVAVREPVVSNNGPVIEAPVETPVEAKAETPVEAKVEVSAEKEQQVQQNNQQKQNHPQRPQHGHQGQRR